MKPVLTLHALWHTLAAPPRFLFLFPRSPTLAHLGRLHPPPPSPLLHLSAPTAPALLALFHLISHIAHHAPRLLANLSTLLFTSPSTSAIRALRPLLPRLAPRLPHLTLLALPSPLPSPCAAARFRRAAAPAAFLALQLHTHLIPARRRHAAAHETPAVLLDAYLTPSFHVRLATRVLPSFAIVATRDSAHIPHISNLVTHETHIRAAANPFFLPPLPPAAVPRVASRRPIWLARTVHRAEERLVLAAHAHVRQRTGLQHALLVVAPTDEARGWGVVRAAGRAGFGRHEVARAGEGGVGPAESVAVYVADVAGAEYAFYEHGRVVLVGDSFVRGGKGWSFGEAAHQACCVVHGPWYDGFDEIVAEVHEEMALQRVLSVGEMAGGEGEVWTAPCVEALDEEDVIELVVAAMGNGERMKRLGSAFQKAIVQLETAAGNDAVQLVGDLMRLAAISTG